MVPIRVDKICEKLGLCSNGRTAGEGTILRCCSSYSEAVFSNCMRYRDFRSCLFHHTLKNIALIKNLNTCETHRIC
jgi:hypothetical protein